MDKKTKDKIKDIIIRALKTFIQGFFGSLIVTLQTTDLTDMALLKSALIGGLSGGISAVMNLVACLLRKE